MSQEATDYFSAVLEAAPIGMLVIDVDGRITFVNAHIERLFGYERSELIGVPLERLLPSRVREKHAHSRADFMKAPQARAMGMGRDLYGLRKDGVEVPVEIGLSPVVIEQGSFVLSSVVEITERKRSEERFRLALEAAPTGMILVDDSGSISLVNAQVEILFGYRREELIGRKIEMLVPERFRSHHPQFRAGFRQAPETRPMGRGRELYGLRKDGSEMPIEIGLNPLTTSDGDFVLSSIADVSARKQSVQQLKEQSAALAATLQEREVLLQEIHHRVKNNLQIIASLVNMQMRKLADPRSRETLTECKTRIDAIALIHQMLYQSGDFSSVPFATYTRGLVTTIFQASGLSFERVAMELAIDELALPVAQAIPCGLIINELVTNALKHAFPEQRGGTIRVALTQANAATLRLEVSDNGIGMPKFVSTAERESIGLHLVVSLADQLDGTLQVTTLSGVAMTVEFPWEAATAART